MKIIIFGANEMASSIAAEFFEDHDVIVIDSVQKNLELFSKLDVGVVCTDVLNLKLLKDNQISNCDVFIACSNDDEANILACFMIKQVSPISQTICFVSKKESMESLNSLKDESKNSYVQNIENIIWPQKFLVQEIFQIITVPKAVDVENFAHGRARLLEYRIQEESELLGKKLKDYYFNSEVLVVGIVRNDELFIPNGNSEFMLNDKAILMGTPVGLDIAAGELFKSQKVKKVAIIGGGTVGYELAIALEKTSENLKLIESDYDRCEELSLNLKKTLILNGSGTCLELLEEEEIGKSDVVVAITNNDEKNLLCSLLSKQLGAKKVITRVSQGTTASLFEKVGVDVAISQREACVNEIKNRIIESRAGIIATVERGQGEIVEIQLNNNFVQKQLMEIKMPVSGVIAIVRRGSKVIIPKGQTQIRPNDTLLIFTKTNDVTAIKEFFK